VKKRNLIKKAVALLILISIFITLCFLKESKDVSNWLAINVSSRWIRIFGRIFSAIPFSVYELSLVATGIAVIAISVVFVKRLIKRRFSKAFSLFLALFIGIFCVANVYTITASFSYSRGKLQLPGIDYSLSDEDVKTLSTQFLEEFNFLSKKMKRDNTGSVVCPYSFNKLSKLLEKEFERIEEFTGDFLFDYTPKPKKLTFSWVTSEMQITGVFFAPYGEVNINGRMPDVDLPVTMAHEMAHAKGIMREYEANLIAYYLTCSSEDDYLRYCGYASVCGRVFSAVHFDSELRKSLYSSLDPLIYTEYENVEKFWQKYDLFSKIADFFNDIYLKLQGVKEGVNDYVDGDIIVDVPVTDGEGNIIIESRYYYSDLQKIIYFLLKQRI